MERRIIGYHGHLPKNLCDILNKIALYVPAENGNSAFWIYTHTLDNFEEQWKGPFLVMGDIIFVTQYHNFGQR